MLPLCVEREIIHRSPHCVPWYARQVYMKSNKQFTVLINVRLSAWGGRRGGGEDDDDDVIQVIAVCETGINLIYSAMIQ